MNTFLLPAVGLLAGAAISIQSALSGQLSQRLRNPMLASASVYLVGFVCIALFLSIRSSSFPSRSTLLETPRHLWVLGGAISATALSSVYWAMPKLGIGSTLIWVICGQLICGALASHLSWFHLPASPLSTQRLLALALVFAGALLYTRQPTI
ncbi:DMT family transporter [Pelagicoccus sp. SDUM812003]|uniref:DMT family transporter n=1 Tax=Pelagicoccus sp. SDUM812003 TaxID=3041267 RepID=UPI00280DD6B1|nr:DMT family transporter [Pelagicoccus sp. SDUM812003]MDQ8203584.1 DMT family transporter [Pelagicoccus sp. SDUM812003]